MDFPIADLMDEDACYAKLVHWLHPRGLACPRCGACDELGVHRRHRAPILDLRCKACRRVFNAFTGTALRGTKRRPVELVLIVRGFAQGVPTAQLARELGCDRSELLGFRHRLQGRPGGAWTGRHWGTRRRRPMRPSRMRGKKGMPHTDPADPPRRRANKARGHGTWDNDRPPVCGVVGREGGQVRLTVAAHTDGVTLHRVVGAGTRPGAMVYTDEWRGYGGLTTLGRGHATVCHADREWARDDDGDGVREVHDNTLEGLWTGLRNFLRPFRGVNKAYLHQYVAMFEWGYNVKRATPSFLRALLGVRATIGMRGPTFCPS